jgi:hypothetical protein
MFTTRNPSKAVAAPEPPAARTPLMDHCPSIHQPDAGNKMFCGFVRHIKPALPKIKVDRWRFNV